MELDARQAPTGTTLSADICIVGAGPAGLALAHELMASGKQVVVLESGSQDGDPEVQELNAGDSTGDPYETLERCRHRGPGGTASIWNTWFQSTRHAKYVPLDDTDFEVRDWVPWSGWPFPAHSLTPFYRRAQALCGPGPWDFQPGEWNSGGHPLLSFPDHSLRNAIYQYGTSRQFTETLPARLAGSESIQVVLGATVIGLTRSAGGERVISAAWATTGGTRGTVRAGRFVLAAGGIENARLLLLFLGERPWLGQGFMEHPVDSSLWISSRHPALVRSGGFYTHRPTAAGAPVLGRIGLSSELLRSHRLRNASLRLLQDEEPMLLQQPAARRAVARRLVPFQPLRRLLGNLVRGAAGLTRPLRSARYRILIDLEQGPHPENRVTLTTRRDGFGLFRPALHWRFREEDRENHRRLLPIVIGELRRARAGRITVLPSVPIDPKHHHHSGTTRMHADPATGVVDENLRVHGMENLFVTGSSVFPTAGFANPTLTALALSVRLADYLATS
jgi:choline dehydrogenase-like flavoprotein